MNQLPNIPTDEEINKKLQLIEEKQMLSLTQYLTASGKYPERMNHPELTEEVKTNAEKLLTVVNAFLQEINLSDVKVSSGWRPSDVNAKVNGAKKSLHMAGLAIDLEDDKEQSLAKACSLNATVLRKFGLFLENPDFTKGATCWVHLDLGTRKDRPNRQFNP